jgi:hypothetical protein
MYLSRDFGNKYASSGRALRLMRSPFLILPLSMISATKAAAIAKRF